MKKPLLSIVVPTKDRYKYLKHLLLLIKSYQNDDWEVVVQDNTVDNTEIIGFIDELNYPGCKYFHEVDQLPMSTNADKAILNSQGEFVCFLGDDDGICPNAIDYCRLMKDLGYDALRSNLGSYLWPDASSRYESIGGRAIISRVTKEKNTLYSKDVLLDVIKRGFVDRGNLPSVYHGIVSRKILDRIYEKCHTFFPGQSPDISNGIAVSLVLPNFLFVDDIITISGASKFHGGVTLGMQKNFPEIKDMVWFRPGAEEIWDKRLPKIAVGSIIWAESSIETLNNMGRQDLVDTINFVPIYKYFAVYFYPIRKMVYPLSSHPFKLAIYANLGIIKRSFNAVCRIIKNKLNVREANKIVINNVFDIQQCISLIESNESNLK